MPIVSWQLLKYLKTIDILRQDNRWPHQRCLPKVKNELLIDFCVCTMRIQTMLKESLPQLSFHTTRFFFFKWLLTLQQEMYQVRQCWQVCGHLCVWGTVFLKTERYRLNKRQECCLNVPQQTSDQVSHALAKLFFNWFIVLKHSFTDALVLALRLHVTPPSPAWTLSL